jgi:hypothetical protein
MQSSSSISFLENQSSPLLTSVQRWGPTTNPRMKRYKKYLFVDYVRIIEHGTGI